MCQGTCKTSLRSDVLREGACAEFCWNYPPGWGVQSLPRSCALGGAVGHGFGAERSRCGCHGGVQGQSGPSGKPPGRGAAPPGGSPRCPHSMRDRRVSFAEGLKGHRREDASFPLGTSWVTSSPKPARGGARGADSPNSRCWELEISRVRPFSRERNGGEQETGLCCRGRAGVGFSMRGSDTAPGMLRGGRSFPARLSRDLFCLVRDWGPRGWLSSGAEPSRAGPWPDAPGRAERGRAVLRLNRAEPGVPG